MKYLIVGLGNVGEKYNKTRHNVGFEIIGSFADTHNCKFETNRYADKATSKIKGKTLILIKPNTFMNLSGKAVRYWLKQEKIPTSRLLIIVDDIALPLGKIRLRAKGGAGGHNGLQNIQELLQTNQYPRLRIGVGNGFSKGSQIDYVLGTWQSEEAEILTSVIESAQLAISTFCLQGIETAMTAFNS